MGTCTTPIPCMPTMCRNMSQPNHVQNRTKQRTLAREAETGRSLSMMACTLLHNQIGGDPTLKACKSCTLAHLY